MAVTERTRHELHEALVELMGRTHTATLMEHLPPTGWATSPPRPTSTTSSSASSSAWKRSSTA